MGPFSTKMSLAMLSRLSQFQGSYISNEGIDCSSSMPKFSLLDTFFTSLGSIESLTSSFSALHDFRYSNIHLIGLNFHENLHSLEQIYQ